MCIHSDDQLRKFQDFLRSEDLSVGPKFRHPDIPFPDTRQGPVLETTYVSGSSPSFTSLGCSPHTLLALDPCRPANVTPSKSKRGFKPEEPLVWASAEVQQTQGVAYVPVLRPRFQPREEVATVTSQLLTTEEEDHSMRGGSKGPATPTIDERGTTACSQKTFNRARRILFPEALALLRNRR